MSDFEYVGPRILNINTCEGCPVFSTEGATIHNFSGEDGFCSHPQIGTIADNGEKKKWTGWFATGQLKITPKWCIPLNASK